MSCPKPQPEHVLESQVWKLLEQGRAKMRWRVAKQLNQRFPAYAPGWYTTSQLAQRLKNPTVALKAINRAMALQPDQPGSCCNRPTAS